MTRFPSHFAAAFAAIIITAFSIQTIATVPSAPLAVVEAPAVA